LAFRTLRPGLRRERGALAWEVTTAPGEIVLNEGREAITLTVANTGDRPIHVGSHHHFFEANPALQFERDKARGCGSTSRPARRCASSWGRRERCG